MTTQESEVDVPEHMLDAALHEYHDWMASSDAKRHDAQSRHAMREALRTALRNAGVKL